MIQSDVYIEKLGWSCNKYELHDCYLLQDRNGLKLINC